MFKPIQFRPEVEQLVRFVEETDPALIVEETLTKLRNGTPADDLIRASALAVVRSTDLPPNHHGGPIHPISGVHAVRNISELDLDAVRMGLQTKANGFSPRAFHHEDPFSLCLESEAVARLIGKGNETIRTLSCQNGRGDQRDDGYQ